MCVCGGVGGRCAGQEHLICSAESNAGLFARMCRAGLIVHGLTSRETMFVEVADVQGYND